MGSRERDSKNKSWVDERKVKQVGEENYGGLV